MQKARKALCAVLTAALLVCSALLALVACAPEGGNDKVAKGIEITTPPTKTDYVVGQTFDPTGMVVSVLYEDDSKEALAATAYTIDPAGALAVSNRRITVTYKVDDENEFTATQNITVHNNVVSVAVKTPATKTGYAIGEVFDPTGMVVTVTYEDGSSKDVDITADNVSFNTAPLTGSETEITLTYSGKEIKQAIEFATGITVKTQPTKTEYVPGERFNPAGMVLEVSYTSGKKADVTVSGSAATYSTEPLTGEETSVTVTYGGFSVTVNITFAKGVFIEAEDGIIKTNSTQWRREGDSNENTPEQYRASGDVYVGDLAPNDSISFVFNSDKAGTGNISFRMASQYLKEDSNWTPIWMGDCQFNKICKVSVNGVEYPIDDSVILPGGGESGGTPDQNLWMNWREVEFRNIAFKAGRNDIKLTFLRHDYADCSQSGKNNVFTANVDSLIITSAECDVTPCELSFNSITATSVAFETKSEVTELVVKGTLDYEGYTAEEVAPMIGFSLAGIVPTVTVTNKNFEIRANVDTLATETYEIQIGIGTELAPLTIAGATATTASCKHGEFATVVTEGVITLTVTSKVEFTFAPVSADIIEESGKAVYVVNGTYTVKGYDENEVKELVKKILLDLQYNGMIDYSWSFTNHSFYAYDVTLGTDGDTLTFTAKYDLTDLANGYYTSHYGSTSTDFKPGTEMNKTITVGGRTYNMLVDPTDTSGQKFWGCVGITIRDVEA